MRVIEAESSTVALYEPGAGRGPRRPRRRRSVPRRVGWLGWSVRLLIGTLLIGVLIMGGTAFRVWQVARIDDRQQALAVVVLGAAQYDGDPSSIFESRLDHAAALFRDGVAPRIVTVGGGRPGDAYTEAEAGRRYLVGQGVPAEAIVAVGEGSDTLGSLRALADRAAADGWDSAVMVSDPWHSLRVRTMARDEGLRAWTSPTRSGPVVQTRQTQARYIVRETAAILFYRVTHASADPALAAETSGVG